jgi:hypothetical protein
MVCVSMGDEGKRQPSSAVALQEGGDYSAPSVTSLVDRSGVNQDPAALGGAEDGSIALADVEKM